MKIAVLINGNFHPYLRRETLIENLFSLQTIFEDCDIFYQTWDDPEDRHVFKDVSNYIDINWAPKPNLATYDAYLKAYNDLPSKSFSGISRTKNNSSSAKKIKAHGCFQHISFFNQFNSIPKKYDFYIRTRWDAYFNENFPLKNILEIAEKNVVGIAAIPNHPSILSNIPVNSNDHYLRVRARRQTLKDQVDKGLYCVINEVGSNNNYQYCRWDNYLKDFCIIFKEEDISGFDVEEYYKNELLYAAEWGWHQILCRKRKHINIDGLVSIYRNIDTSKRMFDKLKQVKLL